MFVGMGRAVVFIPVVMGFNVQFPRNGIKLPVAHARLCQNLVGKGADFRKPPAQCHTFKAGIMINMEVHRGNRQIVMFVLSAHQA